MSWSLFREWFVMSGCSKLGSNVCLWIIWRGACKINVRCRNLVLLIRGLLIVVFVCIDIIQTLLISMICLLTLIYIEILLLTLIVILIWISAFVIVILLIWINSWIILVILVLIAVVLLELLVLILVLLGLSLVKLILVWLSTLFCKRIIPLWFWSWRNSLVFIS